MGGQFATGLLGGGGDLLLGGENHFANLFFGGFLDADFLGVAFLFRAGLHLSDFDIQLAEAIFDFGQAPVGVLAGGARFFQGLLNGSAAVAEHPGQELARGPECDDDDDGEVQNGQQEVRPMHAPIDFTGEPLNRLGVFQTGVFFLLFSGGLTGFLGKFAADTLFVGCGLLIFFCGSGSLLGSRWRRLFLRASCYRKRGEECEEHEREQASP